MSYASSLNSPTVVWRFIDNLDSSAAACVVWLELFEVSLEADAICPISLVISSDVVDISSVADAIC